MKILFAVAAVALVVGCGSKEHKSIKAKAEFTKRICACADGACIAKVEDEKRAYQKKNPITLSDIKNFKESDLKKSGELSKKYRKCKKELMAKHGATHPRVLEHKKLADLVCACKDVKCGTDARDAFNKKNMKSFVGGIMKHTGPHRKRVRKCIRDLRSKAHAKPKAPAPAPTPAKK